MKYTKEFVKIKSEIVETIKKVCEEREIVYIETHIEKCDYVRSFKTEGNSVFNLSKMVHMERIVCMIDGFEETFRNWEGLIYTDIFLVNVFKTSIGVNYVDLLYGVIKDDNKYKAYLRDKRINEILE